METWAHGYDIADTLGITPEPTERLRSIAHLGVSTIPWSFTVHGDPVPNAAFRVTLNSPGGELWTWGPEAPNRITADALDFSLLVTQRRNHQDLDVRAESPDGHRFITLAQAFAGPPGAGRPPQNP